MGSRWRLDSKKKSLCKGDRKQGFAYHQIRIMCGSFLTFFVFSLSFSLSSSLSQSAFLCITLFFPQFFFLPYSIFHIFFPLISTLYSRLPPCHLCGRQMVFANSSSNSPPLAEPLLIFVCT